MIVQQIFPANPQLREEIPLWLKFRAFEYQGFIGRFNNGFQGVQPTPPNQLGTIYVPAPKTISSGVTNKFNENPVNDIFEGVVGALSNLGKAGASIPLIGSIPSKSAAGIASTVQLSKVIIDAASYFVGIAPPDFNDNVYAGTNKRSYSFDLVLPCLTDEDSFAAFAVARAFEAFSIPSVQGKFFFNHPPMWLFGVGPGTGPIIDFTWLTDTQLCTLQSVAVNRSAPDSGTYTVLTRYGFKPSVTTVSLKFIEIEPIYRVKNNLNMITRSQAFKITGVSGTDVFGG